MSTQQFSESFNTTDKNIQENADQSSSKVAAKKDKQKGRWSKAQQLKYFLFLSHHKKKFEEDETRRSLRMYKHMSVFIKSRNPTQCRIRHMKTLKKYGGIDKSIESYVQARPQFYEKYEQIKGYLQLLEDRAYCGDFQNYDSSVHPSIASAENKESDKSVKIQEVKREETANNTTFLLPQQDKPEESRTNFYWAQIITLQPIIYFI